MPALGDTILVVLDGHTTTPYTALVTSIITGGITATVFQPDTGLRYYTGPLYATKTEGDSHSGDGPTWAYLP